MTSAFRVLLVACFLTTTMGLPKHNITVTVPDGFSNHGNDDLFCLPATWYQIAIFFLVNYGSHAVTIKSRPGQTYYHTARDIFFALLCPFSGVLRAIDSFWRCSWPSENDLIKAARAGALCIVVRNAEWWVTRDFQIANKPSKQQQAGATSIQEVQGCDRLPAQPEEKKDRNSADQIEVYEDAHRGKIAKEPDSSPPGLSKDPKATSVNTASEGGYVPAKTASEGGHISSKATRLPAATHRSYRHIHGMCRLPQGYSLTWLPSNAKVISDVGDKPGDMEICSSYSVPKAIIAIVQTIYASTTLYSARGDQIQRYGYAAFGLTVVPYLVMSIMNLIATSLLPDYSTLYIVRSLELDEAITKGAQVDGAVGRIVQSTVENDRFLTSKEKREKGIDSEQASLSIMHAHSKREILCHSPILSEEVEEEFPTAEWWSAEWRTAFKWKKYRNKYYEGLLSDCIFGAIPIAVIGIWTRFDAGESTKAQRVLTMFWLAADILCGSSLDLSSERDNLFEAFGRIPCLGFFARYILPLYWTSLGTIPAIGGFVVVAQMLRAYGTCVEVSGVDS